MARPNLGDPAPPCGFPLLLLPVDVPAVLEGFQGAGPLGLLPGSGVDPSCRVGGGALDRGGRRRTCATAHSRRLVVDRRWRSRPQSAHRPRRNPGLLRGDWPRNKHLRAANAGRFDLAIQRPSRRRYLPSSPRPIRSELYRHVVGADRPAYRQPRGTGGAHDVPREKGEFSAST